MTVSWSATSPGEHLLNQLATRLLLLALAFPHEIQLHPAVPGPEPFCCAADGLGDAITALQACGALSPLSPVPGQLAALCANLSISGHGITAVPAGELPGPWLSVLAHYRHRKPGHAEGRDGCAATALALPELDGIMLTLLGLHNVDGSTLLYAHASGITLTGPYRPPGSELDFPLRIWVRDSGGRWHATRAAARLEHRRRRRHDVAPRGAAAAEPSHHLDRGARRRAIRPGARHAAASLAVEQPGR